MAACPARAGTVIRHLTLHLPGQIVQSRLVRNFTLMNADNFSDLPEWVDERFYNEDMEGEEWKPNATYHACKALYEKWREIVFVLKGLLSTIAEGDDGFHSYTAAQVLQDAYLIGAKIISSEAGGIYIIRMGNAAVVRELAMGIYSSLLLFIEDDIIDEGHIRVTRNEIDNFRLLFIEWVNTFQKDECEDEWGLFV